MSKHAIFFFLLFFFSMNSFSLSAQNRKDLEEKRMQLNEEIDNLSELLKGARKDRKNTVEQVSTLQTQIQKREQLITAINDEVNFLAESLTRNEEVVKSLTRDIKRLEIDYTLMIRNAYRRHDVNNRLLFLFSAKGFNDAYHRWQYLKRYDEYRKKQANIIIRTRKSLSRKVRSYESNKNQKETLLQTEECQREILKTELVIKDKLLGRIKRNERQLRADLKMQKLARNRLLNDVMDVITSTSNEVVEEEKILSDAVLTESFAARKGSLSWPIDVGVITSRYGKQKHPVFKSVSIFNSGIDIKAIGGMEVKAVFQGQVIDVFSVPGFSNAIMIQHGDYFTVYSNIGKLNVKKGDIVLSGQQLGTISKKNEKAEVHFEIWKNKKRQNPAAWIKR